MQQHPLELANFACSGATTTSLLNDVGCPSVALGPGAAPYDSQTQIEAAEAFLQAHPGQVDLITVSIGGNDVTKCAAQPDPVPCVTGAVSEVSTNLTTIVQRLRAAAGPDVLIVGTTYPDVLLGSWVSGNPSDQQLATCPSPRSRASSTRRSRRPTSPSGASSSTSPRPPACTAR